jgi:hypothetical protein
MSASVLPTGKVIPVSKAGVPGEVEPTKIPLLIAMLAVKGNI